jgi:hypothetical protein
MFKQVKALETFLKWVEQLKQHRLYRQHLLTFGTRDVAVVRAQGCSDSPIENSKFGFLQGIKERNFTVGYYLHFFWKF